jgi:hypothetical protein
MCARWQETEEFDYVRVNLGIAGELRLQFRELLARGKRTEPEEVTDLLEGHLRREIVDLIATIEKAPLLTINLAEPRIGDNDALQPST